MSKAIATVMVREEGNARKSTPSSRPWSRLCGPPVSRTDGPHLEVRTTCKGYPERAPASSRVKAISHQNAPSDRPTDAELLWAEYVAAREASRDFRDGAAGIAWRDFPGGVRIGGQPLGLWAPI
jgi:hypothetical protein